MKINCISIDDEKLARSLLKDYISKVSFLNDLGQYKDPVEALAIIEREQVDLIFLDIQMPEMTGLEFLKTLSDSPVIIFTTAYAEYAIEGYQFEVADYLLKPFSLDRFLQAVNKSKKMISLKQMHPEDSKNYLMVKSDHRILKIDHQDIIYIEGLKEYVSIYTEDGKRIITLMALKNLETILPSNFLRVHKSYIVSFNKIKALEGNQLILGLHKIPVGKNYKALILNKFES